MNHKVFNLTLSLISLTFATWAAASPNTTVYDWTGIYIGGFVGGAAAAKITATEPLRIDNNTNWFRPFHQSYRDDSSSSFIGGATIGYNWRLGKTPYLVSLEGEYGYLNANGHSLDANQIPYAALTNNTTLNTSSNRSNIGGAYGYALAGGRIAYAHERMLFYVKSGAVFTKIVNKYHSVKTEPDVVAYLHTAGASNTTGYGIGGGIEYAPPFKALANVSVKIEYLYLGINRTLRSDGHCSCDFLWTMKEQISGIHTAKLGMNYKF